MARVLIGWELGANRGHVALIAPAVATLLEAGHDVAVALQQPDALPDLDPRVTRFQAPVWPGLFTVRPAPPRNPVSTMIDILCRLGLALPGALGGLISAWDGIFAAWRPDVVIGEFSPALLCAARGRMRSIATGTGFSTPPGHVAAMRRLAGEPGCDEAMTLDTIDAELRATGREPLAALPAIFAADDYLVTTFAEIDPYAGERVAPYAPPLENHAFEDGPRGDEIFCYGFAGGLAGTALFDALAATGRHVRVHMPDASAELNARLTRSGIKVEPRPRPWPEIARRSHLVVSHGGHYFTCAALLAGVPHFIAAYDLEKTLHGRALAREGLGWTEGVPGMAKDALLARLNAAIGDDATAARAREAAPGFRVRMAPGFAKRLRALVAGS